MDSEDTRSADPGGLREAAQSVVERFDRVMHQPEAFWSSDDEDAVERLRAALTPEATAPDTGSEYGRLLAERDRLISEGVDPADLASPLPPEEA